MKRLLMASLLLLLVAGQSSGAAAARPELPGDSVYQLPLDLTDQNGAHWDWRSKRGTPQVVAMFYTSCQYTCPLTVESGKAIQHVLSATQQSRLGFLLISMDPARDKPASLSRVIRQHHLDTSRWSLAAPAEGDVRSVAGVLGVRYRKLPSGDFNHTSALVLLDRDGRIVARTDHIGGAPDPVFVHAVSQTLGH